MYEGGIAFAVLGIDLAVFPFDERALHVYTVLQNVAD